MPLAKESTVYLLFYYRDRYKHNKRLFLGSTFTFESAISALIEDVESSFPLKKDAVQYVLNSKKQVGNDYYFDSPTDPANYYVLETVNLKEIVSGFTD